MTKKKTLVFDIVKFYFSHLFTGSSRVFFQACPILCSASGQTQEMFLRLRFFTLIPLYCYNNSF